jgi:hypothetical protein
MKHGLVNPDAIVDFYNKVESGEIDIEEEIMPSEEKKRRRKKGPLGFRFGRNGS